MAEYTVLAAATKNDLRAVLGDAASSTFVPRLKFSRWDGEVEFSVAHDLTGMSGTKTFSQSAGTYLYDNARLALKFYEKPEGYEFELILKRKPSTNAISLPITTKGLVFYYQPPLTEEWRVGQKLPWGATVAEVTDTEAIDDKGFVFFRRPEDVVGSYAVYHATRRDDYSLRGGMNYQAGKVLHIYRPKLTDALGVSVWATLQINEQTGRLIITAPQSFLDTATYPVIVDPTFGSSGTGAGSSSWPDGYILGAKYACSESGTITSISAHVGQDGGAVSVQMGVYSSAATPARVDYTGSVSADASMAWKTASGILGGSLSAANYWLCINGNSAYKWSADSAVDGDLSYTTGAFGTWPTSLTGWANYVAYKMSIYCTYTAGGTAYTLSCAGGSYAVTGTAMTPKRAAKIAAAAGSYAVTGTAASPKYGRKLAAGAGSYALTGQAMTPKRAANISAEAGTYGLTGGAVGTLYGRKMSAEAGAYGLTGTAADLLYGRVLAAEAGEYAITGDAASLLRDALLAAEAGSYALTGADVAALYGRLLAAEAGEYALTGADAGAYFGRVIAAESGTYSITGSDITLVYTGGTAAYVLTCEGGAYALTGAAVGLLRAARVTAESGAYVVTGAAASTLVGRLLDAGAGVYAMTGAQAGLLRTAILAADAGSYALTGQDAGTYYGRHLDAEAGLYSVSGQTAALLRAARIGADAGAYAVTGTDASLRYTYGVPSAFIFPVQPRNRIVAAPCRQRIKPVPPKGRISKRKST